MKNKIFSLVKTFVIESFTNSNKIHSIKHLKRTVYWVKFLYPKANEELLTAAISHDIARAFETPAELDKFKKVKNIFINSGYLKFHQNMGAKIIYNFLTNHDINKKTILTITNLIKKHEVGGNIYQNILKDADSISFFETSSKSFINMTKEKKEIKEKIKLKFDRMYNRITSKKAQKIALPLYTKSIKNLNSI